MRKLEIGDQVFAYMKGLGYTGYGIVTAESKRYNDFVLPDSKRPIAEVKLEQPNLSRNNDDEHLSEYLIGIDWKKTFAREEAKTFKGIFTDQNIVCKLRDRATIDYLEKGFRVVIENV